MNNLDIVIWREYFVRVKKPSFIILTVLMPFLVAAMVFVPVLFSLIKDDEAHKIAVSDTTGKYEKLFVEVNTNDSLRLENYVFLPADRPFSEYRSEDSEFSAVISITADLVEHPEACRIYSTGEVQHELQQYVEDILSDQIRRDKLAAYNVPQLDNIIEDVQSRFSVKTVKWTADGDESESSSALAMVLGMIMAMLIYMFVLIYGAMVMQSVMEEKTNRIVEVIVGSVKPFNLMMGKIIGIMFVGFTQILIWVIMGAIIFGILGMVMSGNVDPEALQQGAMATASPEQQAAMQAVADNAYTDIMSTIANLPLVEVGVLFILYFLGGYILYSSFYAAIGAAINSQEDSSQFMMPMVIVMIIALYGAMGSMENTDGPLAFWASLFPLTSPIVMMVRIPFGVPLWQEVLSVALLYATALGFVWASGRIYRVGILMYGKKPTFKELLKWIK